jgi:hypothetical protein
LAGSMRHDLGAEMRTCRVGRRLIFMYVLA